MTWNITTGTPYTEEAVIQFGGLTLPAGSTVTGASLALTFDNWSTGFTVRGYYLKNSWHLTSSLGWLNRDPNLLWAVPGARGSGTDILASPTFSVSGFAGTGVEPKTIALDPAVVQGWITNPSTNQGVLLVNEANDLVTRIYSSKDGTQSRRPQLTISYTTGQGCVSGGVSTWTNTSFSPGANPFTVSFDATPSASPTDAVVGLSLNAASAFSNLATIVRFNTTGTIDARNGGAYAASTSVPYAANTSYHFRLVVNVSAHTYSIFVTPSGGTEQTVGTNFAFRTEQAMVASLNNWASEVDTDGLGTINVCNFAVAGGGMDAGAEAGVEAGAEAGVEAGAEAGMDAGPSGQHPRIWLDPTTLSTLRAKAQAGAVAWTTLRAACNSYLGGTVNPVGGNAYPNLPDVGEGYQGSSYFDAIMNTGLCYQIGLGLSPPDANTVAWGTKGADILSAMTLFTTYSRDSGYGIRFFGAGMALGFDFLYPALSSSAKSQVSTSLNAWLSWFTTTGFGEGHPQGNYFAGYYATEAYAGIATAGNGDNSNADALWTDFLTRLHRGGPTALSAPDGTHSGVQSYYSRFMTGGGWTEGWGYGGLALSNMALPSLAAKTGKGIDLIQDPAAPYSYPLDNGMHLMQFAWPSRTMMDDRDDLHQGNAGTSFPAQPNPAAFTVTAAMLSRWGHSLAPQFHAFARGVRTAYGIASPWQDFLFWDDGAAEQDFTTLPRSYQSSGLNAVAMRSDWGVGATWASFRATGYVDYGYSGEEYYDAGGLAIVKGATPLLANATGALVTSFPGTNGAGLYETQVYNDLYNTGTRQLFNTFANGTGGMQGQYPVDGASPPATRVTRFEDRNGYVQMRGENIQAVYNAAANMTNWTRDVVYLRPSAFVVYDRTSVANTSGDQHMSWHLFFTPALVAPPSSGAIRYDVTNSSAGFLGSVTTVLPASANASLVNVFGSSKVYRLEVRPSTQATDLRWLTVFDTSASAGAVALASALTSSANVKGILQAAATGNSATLFGAGAAGTNVTGAVTFTEPAVATKVVATDLAPNSPYAVTAMLSGSNHNVTINTGTGFTTSPNGTLYVMIAANGAVTAGN